MNEHTQRVVSELEIIAANYVPGAAGPCVCPHCGNVQSAERERMTALFMDTMPLMQEAVAEFLVRFANGEEPHLGMRAQNGVRLTTNLMRMMAVGLNAYKAQVQAANKSSTVH